MLYQLLLHTVSLKKKKPAIDVILSRAGNLRYFELYRTYAIIISSNATGL